MASIQRKRWINRIQGLKESVSVETTRYRRAHGKSPNKNERGGWWFTDTDKFDLSG